MRIGIFTDAYRPNISGVVTSVCMLENGLRALGHEVIIITTSAKDAPKKESNVIRLKGFYVPKKGLSEYRLAPITEKRLKQIQELELDVMHVHTEITMGGFARLIRKRLKIPMVYTIHTMYEDYLHHITPFGARFFKRQMMNYVKKRIGQFVADSDEVILPTLKVEATMRRYNIEGSFNIIPTGIDLTKFYKESYDPEDVKTLKDKLGIKNELIFLFVGRIAKEKSLDVIIDEFAKIHKEINAKLMVVGEGPALKDIIKQIEDLKIERDVILTGRVKWDDIGLYYQCGDVFVNASMTETQGLTYIEALAASLPVVVKYDTCIKDLIHHEENGLFYHENKEFSIQLKRLFEDETLRKKLIDKSAKSVEKYSEVCYATSVLEVYSKAIARH